MKIDTTTLLLIGAAGVAVYLVTRPAVNPLVNPATGLPYASTPYNPYATPAYNPYGAVAPGNTTGGIISAGGSALEGLSDLIGNFF